MKNKEFEAKVMCWCVIGIILTLLIGWLTTLDLGFKIVSH